MMPGVEAASGRADQLKDLYGQFELRPLWEAVHEHLEVYQEKAREFRLPSMSREGRRPIERLLGRFIRDGEMLKIEELREVLQERTLRPTLEELLNSII